MYDYNTKALDSAIEDTFDDVMTGYEKRPEVEEAAAGRDAIFEDLLSRHPEDTDLLRELWDGVLNYTADYVATAYVEGVKYGIKNSDEIKRFAAEDDEPEI
jgi:hypothetical protein